MQSLMYFFAIAGILEIFLAVPLIKGRVKPNPYYGYRIRATMENPELWYAVNAYFGKRFLVCGLVVIAASVLFYLAPGMTVDVYSLSVLFVVVLSFGMAFYQTARFIRLRTQV